MDNKYSDMKNWVYYNSGENKPSDVFFICPTVDIGENGDKSMNLSNEKVRNNFIGAVNMEIGIYNENSAVYAPFYRQATMIVGIEPYADEFEERLEIAYSDIREAFLYYLENCDKNKPLIIAGFSQGSIMAKRLLTDFFKDEDLRKRLVAAYLIGWGITRNDYENAPWLSPAQDETDTGVIVSFNTEAEEIKNSVMVPEGTETISINPLNWKTDSTVADKSENLGACFTDYEGNINKEISSFTGAYLKPKRGTLVPTEVSPKDYPTLLFIHGLPYPKGFELNGYKLFPDGLLFENGIYHVYDYLFFYRNLQGNVKKRLEAYLKK